MQNFVLETKNVTTEVDPSIFKGPSGGMGSSEEVKHDNNIGDSMGTMGGMGSSDAMGDMGGMGGMGSSDAMGGMGGMGNSNSMGNASN
mmetsp:Transcript_32506/g.23484  ORF Transcript_32506/g.23484 Transcript_32506/m.23484 type:complete len:88 (-) Transcript_32506:789-1052(-)